MQNTDELHQEINELKEVVAQQTHQIFIKNQHIKALEELLANLKKRHFAPTSEKSEYHQMELIFDEAEQQLDQDTPDLPAETTVVIAEHNRRKHKRVSIPAELPRVEVIHDLPEDQKICPHDQAELKRIGSETSEQLEIIPASIRVLKHVRYKYACPCCEQHLVTAKKPKQAIEKSIASASLLAYVATQKYVDGLPLYRQLAMFKRIGIELDNTTLANWMIKCGELVQPLINLLHEKILEHNILHMDETTVQVLKEPDKPPQSKSHMWVVRSPQAVLFHYEPTRRGDVATELLVDFKGALMVDGYEGYNAICVANQLTRLGCWAHVRRKFMDALQVQPKGKTGKADEALALIQKLYRIEKETQSISAAERCLIRQQQAQPLLDKLKVWLDKRLPGALPSSAIGKALLYLHNQWSRLIIYVQHGDYPIDNNAAENAVRPFVIGRKNWLFSTSQRGAKASANLYTLVESAKINALDPWAYLLKIFTELPLANTIEDVEALLPWHVKSAVA